MLIPRGRRLQARPASCREGATATDLVLTVTQMLRKKGVVDKFVEFFGAGLDALSLPDRATIANMAPEYGATMGFFPVDDETLAYLRFTGRDEEHVAARRALLQGAGPVPPATSAEPALHRHARARSVDGRAVARRPGAPAGPRPLARATWRKRRSYSATGRCRALERRPTKARRRRTQGRHATSRPSTSTFELGHGAVVIAAITSCTNTSNPSVLIAAGLLAKKAVARGPGDASRGSRPASRPARRSSPTT